MYILDDPIVIEEEKKRNTYGIREYLFFFYLRKPNFIAFGKM